MLALVFLLVGSCRLSVADYDHSYQVDLSLTFRWSLDQDRFYVALDEPDGAGWVALGASFFIDTFQKNFCF